MGAQKDSEVGSLVRDNNYMEKREKNHFWKYENVSN